MRGTRPRQTSGGSVATDILLLTTLILFMTVVALVFGRIRPGVHGRDLSGTARHRGGHRRGHRRPTRRLARGGRRPGGLGAAVQHPATDGRGRGWHCRRGRRGHRHRPGRHGDHLSRKKNQKKKENKSKQEKNHRKHHRDRTQTDISSPAVSTIRNAGCSGPSTRRWFCSDPPCWVWRQIPF